MRKLLASLKSHPIATIFVLVVLLVIGGNCLANRWADRRWQSYCNDARARGVKIQLADFIPAEIPDSENFAALPIFRALAGEPGVPSSDPQPGALTSDSPGAPMSLSVGPGRMPGIGDPIKGARLDWEAWQRYFQQAGFIAQPSDNPVRDVLTALDHYAPQVSEWREWRSRPRARFSVEYNKTALMAMPWLNVIRDAVKLFALRMRAHLELGDSAAAYADFRDGLAGCLALKNEPTCLAGVSRISELSRLISAVGNGLSGHRWGEPELRKLQTDLEMLRMWDDYRLTLSSERGFENATFDELAKASPVEREEMLSEISGPIRDSNGWVYLLTPRWFFRDNQLRQNQDIDELIARASADGSAFTLDAPNPSNPANITGDLERYHYFLFANSAHFFTAVANRFVTAETQLRQAICACAIERFYLANRTFPETIMDLVPKFIAEAPMDIYSGQPMIYRRAGAASFTLYSVGPNRIDDHGLINPKKQERQQLDDVWLYAPAGLP